MTHNTLMKKSKDTKNTAGILRHFVDRIVPKIITTTKKGDFSNPPAVYIRNERIISQILNES